MLFWGKGVSLSEKNGWMCFKNFSLLWFCTESFGAENLAWFLFMLIYVCCWQLRNWWCCFQLLGLGCRFILQRLDSLNLHCRTRNWQLFARKICVCLWKRLAVNFIAFTIFLNHFGSNLSSNIWHHIACFLLLFHNFPDFNPHLRAYNLLQKFIGLIFFRWNVLFHWSRNIVELSEPVPFFRSFSLLLIFLLIQKNITVKSDHILCCQLAFGKWLRLLTLFTEKTRWVG